MYIKRDKYLNDIINRMHNGMIKVITGIRRSGKSYLVFNIFNDYLKSEGVAEDHIIKLEIDFIATLGSKKYYLQSAFSLPDEEKVKQEKASLLNVNDSFKKIIVVKDITKPQRDENGIVTINLYDFLLNENSLDF